MSADKIREDIANALIRLSYLEAEQLDRRFPKKRAYLALLGEAGRALGKAAKMLDELAELPTSTHEK